MIIIKHAQMSSFIGSKFCDTTLEIFQGCHGNGIPVPVAILPLRMSGNSLIIPRGFNYMHTVQPSRFRFIVPILIGTR